MFRINAFVLYRRRQARLEDLDDVELENYSGEVIEMSRKKVFVIAFLWFFDALCKWISFIFFISDIFRTGYCASWLRRGGARWSVLPLFAECTESVTY